MSKKPVLLCIMDGFGWTPNETYGNAVAAAKKPFIDSLMAKYPMTTIDASGMAVGLPDGQMGNSEVGHTNMGAGRIVYQQLTLITKSIRDGEMLKNPVLVKNMKAAIDAGKAIHLMGLVGTGGVHSHADHWFGVLEMAKQMGAKEVYLHCITDGRDTDPHSGKGFLADLQAKLDELGIGKIASVSGRYYAMDRDNNWDREEKAYAAFVYGEGNHAANAQEAIEASYADDKTDEFVLPCVTCEGGRVQDGDTVIFMNFRPDRARQMTRIFCDDAFTGFERLDAGITPDIVREISAKKDEPQWMLDLRLKSLEIFNRFPDPTWGPSIEGLDMDNIVTYVKPNTDQKHDWESVPDDIKNTFERLGIPEAERSYLAGVGAQYDSELVYHNMQETASKMGIVYSGIEEALHDPQWEPLIHEKFMTLIPPTDHKFAALHGAVWSGGSFVYVPKGTKLDFPLQSYFRLNAKGAGQFEHTLIIVEDDADLHFIEGCSAPKYNVANLHAGAVELFVGKRAHLRYSTIENWSKNMYNLNTKRARVDEDGDIEWISGSFGSHVGYLYPMSVLNGRRARSSFTGITFAGAGQNLDTGCKVVLNAPETSATVETKGISKSGGIQTFRSSIVATPKAEGSKATVSCQSLMLDDQSRSDTIPAMDIRAKNVDIGHEATIGRIGDDKVFYLMSRGLSEEEAMGMIVRGFVEPISRELPMEYALELNRLVELQMEGSVG